jgi:sulfur-carrier protein adenylyltransferase/sulfurtransferase
MNDNERYQRQISLKEFGERGQQKLLSAKVFVAGVGGLGCPALLYLAAAGIGTIGFADDDVVSLSNLHRQVLFSMEDIGMPKVQVAEKRLKQLNPGITIISYPVKLTNQNVLNILRDYDVIIDGTDNFAVKYLLNDACVLLDKPLIYGSISKFEGQVAILNVSDEKNAKCNYRDLFPQPPTDEIPNCAEDGVLGVVTGIIGTMQANEAIKLITGIGEPLINRLMIYNSLNSETYIVKISENKDAYISPVNEEEFIKMNYDWLCETNQNVEIIDAIIFRQMLTENNTAFIDVREKDEKPDVHFFHKKIPLSQFENEFKNIDENRIVLFCQTGKRSLKAAQILLNDNEKTKKVYSLKDGILSLF